MRSEHEICGLVRWHAGQDFVWGGADQFGGLPANLLSNFGEGQFRAVAIAAEVAKDHSF